MENAAIGSHPGGSGPGHEEGAAAMPQLGQQASLGGLGAETRHSLLKILGHRRLWVYLISFCALLVLCYFLSASKFSASVALAAAPPAPLGRGASPSLASFLVVPSLPRKPPLRIVASLASLPLFEKET